MSKFQCRCGENVATTVWPSDHEGRLWWDRDTDGGHEPRRHPGYYVFQCPKCERLYVSKEPGCASPSMACFIPEHGERPCTACNGKGCDKCYGSGVRFLPRERADS